MSDSFVYVKLHFLVSSQHAYKTWYLPNNDIHCLVKLLSSAVHIHKVMIVTYILRVLKLQNTSLVLWKVNSSHFGVESCYKHRCFLHLCTPILNSLICQRIKLHTFSCLFVLLVYKCTTVIPIRPYSQNFSENTKIHSCVSRHDRSRDLTFVLKELT
jgi:hypothetical protein